MLMCADDTVLLSRGARGPLVAELQVGLGLKADGDFGPKTEEAVRVMQKRLGITVNGVVTGAFWRGVFREEPPGLFERCLGLTASFEGHGYTAAAGNWDGAGMTWGIIGFTAKSRSLFHVLEAIPRTVVAEAFALDGGMSLGHEAAEAVIDIGRRLQAERVAWGDRISDPAVDPRTKKAKAKLLPTWQVRFARLGQTKEGQAAQRKIARELYWTPAVRQLESKLPALRSERAYAMAFDCWVQQGGIYPSALAAAAKAVDEKAALKAIAEAQAQGPFAADIRSRRMTIAVGAGIVHRSAYTLDHFGLTYAPGSP
jgi:peptidoglycan hydrolase-like protein with peptidoglycan-binding domain